MATAAILVTKPVRGVTKLSWTITGTDDGASGDAVHFQDKCVQVQAAAFGGGTVIMEGSNDGGTNWFQLHFADGTAASFTANGGNALLESPLKIRPRASVSVGANNVAVNVVGISSR